nr:oligosaccharide flippase family protein [Candidatus Njordarchaeota archaeon]
MSVGGVARGGLFLIIGSTVLSILGLAYWSLISLFSGVEPVGIASSVFSLSVLASGIATLGVPVGVQRFLGRDFSRKDIENLNTYFWSSFAFTLILCLVSAIIIWCIALLNVPLIGFSENQLTSAGLIAILSFSPIIAAFFTSIIKTEYIAISYVVAAITRLGLGGFLVYSGLGWLGAVAGIILSYLSMGALMLFFALKELRRLGGIKVHFSFKALRESLHAGFATWIPGVIALLGQQLGTLTVFGLQGGFEAGAYFVAYAIFGIIYTLPTSLTSFLFPILSGLTNGGKEVAWKVLKLCLALACPSTAFVIFYPGFLLSLIGGDYIQSASTLTLLVLSTIPLTFISAMGSLIYAAGSYRKVLGIGLTINIPRVILYFLLVPIYGGSGAALSFLIGSATGLVAAIYLSKVADFQVSSRKIAVIIVAPFGAGLTCFLMGLNWFISGTIILVTSVLCYGRSGVVERSDLTEIARAFASEKTIANAGKRLNWLLKMIYGE